MARTFQARLLRVTLVGIASLSAALLLFTTHSISGPAAKRDLTIGSAVTMSLNLDPRLTLRGANEIVPLYNGLLRFDVNLKVKPELARRWEFEGDKAVVFFLQRGVKWPDGRELTAYDVKYSFDTVRNPQFGSPNVNNFEPIERIEVIDDYTVRFVLKRPYPSLLGWLTTVYSYVVPRHVPGERLRTQPFGSGPFTLAEYVPAERVVLKAKPDYWEGRPKLDTVTFRAILEDAVRLVALETGQIDVAFGVPLGEVPRLQRDPRFEVYRLPPSGFEYVGIQTHKPPFNDVRVRQAMAYAINRDEIVKVVFNNLAQVIYGPVMPGSWAYNKEVEKIFPYDPDKARRLLAEAGYPNGFSVKLYMSGRWQEPEWTQVIQAQLRRVGINVQIVQMEFSSYLDTLSKDSVDGMFVLAWVSQWDPDQHLYRPFHSRNIAPAGPNWSHYKNPKVDDLLDKARSTMNQDLRRRYYQEVQKIIVEDVPYLFLQDVPQFVAIRKGLKNFKVGAAYEGMLDSLLNAEWETGR